MFYSEVKHDESKTVGNLTVTKCFETDSIQSAHLALETNQKMVPVIISPFSCGNRSQVILFKRISLSF